MICSCEQRGTIAPDCPEHATFATPRDHAEAAMRACLRYLDVCGGLGLDKHREIREALALPTSAEEVA